MKTIADSLFVAGRALLAALLLSAPGFALANPELAREVEFKVPSQRLADAILLFSDQASVQIVTLGTDVKDLKSPGVSGRHKVEEALRLMLKGTGLRYKLVGDGTITIGREELSAPAARTNDAAAALRAADVPLELVRAAAPRSAQPAAEERRQAGEGGEIIVTGSRLPRTESEGPSPVLTYDRDYIERAGFGTLEEFMRVLPQNFAAAGRQTVPNDENPALFGRQPGQSGLGLRGLGSNNTLVLINGRRAPLSARGNAGTPTQQSFFDINTIPIGLIERIEVLTDGASAVYGTDAIAGVVNIILKEQYSTTEAKTRFAGTEHGGGFERGGTFSHGFGTQRLSITTSLDVFEREQMQASQRSFSASSDHRGQGGGDYRSTAGYPATIYALPGQYLPGVFNSNGTQARFAVVPANQDGRNLTRAAFSPTASTQSFYNQSEMYSLVTPTQRYGASSRVNFRVSDRLTLRGEVAYTYTDSTALANPLSTTNTSGSASLPRIPASNPFNPFSVTLGLNMTHAELGARHLIVETESTRFLAGATVELGKGWSAETSMLYYLQDLHTDSPSIDNAALQAALNQTDPALALNVFGDASLGPTNAPGVYEGILSHLVTDSESAASNADFLVRGPLWTLPAGPIRASLGGEWNRQDRLQTTNTPSPIAPAHSKQVRDDYAAYGELQIPFFGGANSHRLLRRLELSLAGRWQSIEEAGETFNPKYGLVWSPSRSLMFRASFGTGYRAPALSELAGLESERSQNIIDRARGNQRYSVNVINGSFPNLKPETSRTWNLGLIVQAPLIQGLSFSFDGYRKDQKNLTTSLTAQQMVDFENLFADRVLRGEPSAADITAGRAGLLIEIDGRSSNFGQLVTEGWDFNANYDLKTSSLGRFLFRLGGTWLGSYKVAFNPGDPLVERQGSVGFPQKLRGNVSVMWDRGRWGGALFVYHQGEAQRGLADRVSSWTTADVNVGFEWSEHLRLQAGVANLLDEEPPFADTIWGYDGSMHNPRMRSYRLSASYRF